ncbi:hypothetical protein CANCADRAFT_71760 [Tortispora caseinolytica NRRL Y-17796]|uniref:Uncharacterized protein n=1 Tax=Tortispora caseinolytica NRRL Y-17796 TaxID=767744 RepID=A0A1E4TIB8_9ASCO|nr:hypothetical protein CANCADRAFT_71760 [Tortispora caseinolytica NRRL Y-17796]
MAAKDADIARNPLKIFGQIVLIQCFYYLSAGIMIAFMCSVMKETFTLDLLFGWRQLDGTRYSDVLRLIWLIESAFVAMFIMVVVRRSRLILDFTLTTYILAILVCCLFSGAAPASVAYWAIQVADIAISLLLGTWAARQYELRDEFFGSHRKQRRQNRGRTDRNDAVELEALATSTDATPS